jgi:integrase
VGNHWATSPFDLIFQIGGEMAHIQHRPERKNKPWKAIVHRVGHGTFSKSFAKRKDAELWGNAQDESIDRADVPLTISALKKVFVIDIVTKYRDEVTPSKGCHVSETAVLNRFLRHPIAKKSLAAVTRQDAYSYRNDRLKDTWQVRGSKGPRKPIQPSTVRREINSIQHVFETAKEEWGYTNLTNHFRGLPIKGGEGISRERILRNGEMQKLQEACRKCHGDNKFFVPLAIYLAVETGMRLQEIFNLTWKDLDLENRLIEIRKSKTDYKSRRKGRTIVMSARATGMLTLLRLPLKAKRRLTEANSVFLKDNGTALTKDAFKQAWGHVLANAKIDDLTFHDLRHEAGTRFDEAGLTKAEHDLMMGHKSRDMTSRYIHGQLKNIQDKLDRYDFDGKTFAEYFEAKKSRRPLHERLKEMMATIDKEVAKDKAESERERALVLAARRSRQKARQRA